MTNTIMNKLIHKMAYGEPENDRGDEPVAGQPEGGETVEQVPPSMNDLMRHQRERRRDLWPAITVDGSRRG
jgi:hypothetical protein